MTSPPSTSVHRSTPNVSPASAPLINEQINEREYDSMKPLRILNEQIKTIQGDPNSYAYNRERPLTSDRVLLHLICY